MKKLLLLIPAIFLMACENNPTTVCKNEVLYTQIGVTGSVYRKTDPIITCIDINAAKALK